VSGLVIREFPVFDDLRPLIERSARFGIASRAEKAAELVASGKVRKLPSVGQDRDRWQVTGETGIYQVSVNERMCGCRFSAYNRAQAGYAGLCSHQLAAIFLSLWWGMGNRIMPDQVFTGVFGQAVKDAAAVLDLRVTVRFNNHAFDTTGRRMASANQETVDAYRTHARHWIEMAHPVVISGHAGDVQHPDLFSGFWPVVDKHNWRICARHRTGTFEFIYRFVPYAAPDSLVGVNDPWMTEAA
jgi:hypothetical protein